MKKRWIIGTRGSKLALKQTEIVVKNLEYLYPDNQFLIKTIKTTGDTIWDTPLNLIGGKGLFVTEIEEKLLNKEIDMAVHSMKDLPTELKEGLTIGAVLKREDSRDVFISFTYDSIKDIKHEARIGTSSLRRKAQILHYNSKIEVVPLRGNVDTRIKKIKTQSLDGIILAYAGVKRMGLEGYIKEILPLDVMIPSSGQGAIGIEIRNKDEVFELLKPINHENSFYEVSIERKLQSKIGGGCHVPLGINATLSDKILTINVALGNEDGKPLIKEKQMGNKEKADELISNVLKKIVSFGHLNYKFA
jgi:hydroxymethylbilane synthase